MRAWIQQLTDDSPFYINMEQAAHWFGRRGYEVLRFRHDELACGRLDEDLLGCAEDMVLRGGVGTVQAALARAGRPIPPALDLPPSLETWFGRRVWRTTLGEVRSRVESVGFEPCHIKPLERQKLFTGMVVRAFRDLIRTASLADDIAVLAQGVVRFRSEWRAYILRGEVLRVGHYRGDPLLFPDPKIMLTAVEAFVEQPIAFAMDWGVDDEGRTLLVEVNDGYSLGNYGLSGPAYTAMAEARWRQLMGLADNGVGRGMNDEL